MADAQRAMKNHFVPHVGEHERVQLTDSEDEDSDYGGDVEKVFLEMGRGGFYIQNWGYKSSSMGNTRNVPTGKSKADASPCSVKIEEIFSASKIPQPEDDFPQTQEEENIENTQESTVENLSQKDQMEDQPAKPKEGISAMHRNEGGRRASERLKKFTGSFMHGNFILQVNLWDKIEKFKWNLLVVYDFNIIRFSHERNKIERLHRHSCLFNSVIRTCELIEIDMPGGQYTWSNNQENPTLVKLDRVLMSKQWEAAIPHVIIQKLPREIIDHNPLIVCTESN
ncbi:hypothetical protein U9M48_027306, partial [Paspalum notatum var. saurae]